MKKKLLYFYRDTLGKLANWCHREESRIDRIVRK